MRKQREVERSLLEPRRGLESGGQVRCGHGQTGTTKEGPSRKGPPRDCISVIM